MIKLRSAFVSLLLVELWYLLILKSEYALEHLAPDSPHSSEPWRAAGRIASQVKPKLVVEQNSSRPPTCICNGHVVDSTEPINLASPFFYDGKIYLQPGGSPSCCENLRPDTNKTHVLFTTKTTQYGHFIFNGVAPLWDAVRHANKKLVIHMISTARGSEMPFVREYLSMFGEVKIHPYEKMNQTTMYLDKPILGLSNVTLDHYNRESDPDLWQGFRDFLIAGHGLKSPRKSSKRLRFTFVQRSRSRSFLKLDDTISKLRASLGTEFMGKLPSFKVVEFENATAAEQARAMGETDILIGADGTGLLNGIYLPTGSCIISVLPYGIQELLPFKGSNFERLFWKLGTTYIKFPSLPVNGSKELYQRAEELPTDCCHRYILLEQDILIDREKLIQAVHGCFESFDS